MISVDPLDPAVTYAAVLDALPIVAFMARSDGSISYMSDGWERLTGISPEQLLAEGYNSVVHTEDIALAARQWAQSIDTTAPYEAELRVRFADGSYRWMVCRAEPLRGETGAIGWFGTLTDIDARKTAEAALTRSESTYRALSAAIPGVTWAASPAGNLTFVGDRWTALHGRPREDALGESWLESLYPPDRDRVLATWAASLTTGAPYDIQFRLRVVDGTYRWFLVRALPIVDDAGATVQWVGVNVDIDDQRRADESREEFVQLIESSDDFIAICNENGEPRYINEAGRRLLAIDSLEQARAQPFVDAGILESMRRTGRWMGEHRLLNILTGEPVPVSFNVFALRDDAGDAAGFAMVGRDLRPRLRVEMGLRLLAETGAVMFRSLDFAQTVRNVVDAVTHEFATYCIVDMFGSDGRLHPIVSAHSDPARGPLLERAVRARLINDDHHTMRAARDGRSTFIAEVGVEWSSKINASPVADLEAIAARSMMCVPIRSSAEGDLLGALTFVVDGRDARGGYRAEDVAFGEEVGLRAGIAFNHARAFERERRIAMTLQEASLPAGLPPVDNMHITADYRPGSSEATIGGDWYDAFVLDDGRVVFTIGDVMGNGLAAAVTMGKLRQVMQSIGLVLGDPSLMLAAADRTIRSIAPDAYATALAAIYDPKHNELTVASAGHPAPLLQLPTGLITELSAPGIMLGLREPDDTTITVAIPPGSTIIFFTDGLIETTRNATAGIANLRQALTTNNIITTPNPAATLVENLLNGAPATDDIAVLVATITPTVAIVATVAPQVIPSEVEGQPKPR